VVLNQSGRTSSRQAVWAVLHALLVLHQLPERSFHAPRHYLLTALVRGGANLEAVRELCATCIASLK
jgi:site-specific recombinase XerD